jgi:hypothetical protein
MTTPLEITGTTPGVRIPEGSNLNQLLNALIPNIDIISVREMIPDMNQIFIEAVNKFNSEQA